MSCITQSTCFLEKRCQTRPDWQVKKSVEDDWWYWFPVMMGICTRDEIAHANYEQIQIFNEVAKQKLELTRGSESVDG